jgi:hypothetical protein
LIVQETGFQMLTAQGYTLVAADDPDAFTASTPTQDLIRQVLGAVAQFEKANLVAKLKAARDRRSAELRASGRRPLEGRQAGRRRPPSRPWSLAARSRRGHGRGGLPHSQWNGLQRHPCLPPAERHQVEASGVSSYRGIADVLNARGVRTARGGDWHATTVRNMLMRQPTS